MNKIKNIEGEVSKGTPTGIGAEEIHTALEQVIGSEEFEGAGRLKEFLRYVVLEHLDGRGASILGKRIAEDVYGRRADSDGATANVVRVDAGRLRRRLDIYYLEEGASDPVRIHIDRGGYSPRFSRISADTETKEPNPETVGADDGERRRKDHSFALVGLAGVAAFGGLIWVLSEHGSGSTNATNPTSQSRVERGVLFETSPTSLQAINIAEQARTLLFPATQPSRLRAALILFEEAIEQDPSYFGGHAGAAQAAAMFGALSPDAGQREAMLGKARLHAEEAVRIGPTEAWSQSSMAFLNMFERNFDEAERLSKRALELEPDNQFTLEIDAIIAFFAGDFERAIQNTTPDLHKGRSHPGFPWQSVRANAFFHVGDYESAIDAHYQAAERGGPVSAINSAHLIASLQAAGRRQEATRLMDTFLETWPSSRLDELMLGLFHDPDNAERLLSRLRSAGWSPS